MVQAIKSIAAAAMPLVVAAGIAHGATFSPGSLVVYRTGNGSGAVTSAPAPVFLDEYSPTGALLQSIALPTAASGVNKPLIAQGDAALEGLLHRSADGKSLLLTGYNHQLGTPIPAEAGGNGTLAQTNSSVVNRTIGRVDAAGLINTATTISDSGQGSPRSAVSDDGVNLWVSHGSISGGTDGGVRYTTVGATGASTMVSNATTDPRTVNIFNGQLYLSTVGGGSNPPVQAIGSDLPHVGGQTTTGLTGVLGSTSRNVIDFFLADLDANVHGPDTLYVSGDNEAAITKYSLVESTWISNGTVGTTADDYRGIAGVVSGSSVTLYATRANGASADSLVSLVDSTGYNSTAGAFSALAPTTIATAGANTLFKGVAFAPVNPTAIPGDFTGNGVVDGDDLDKWKVDFGTDGSDANGDTITDGADFLVWQRHYGEGAAPSFAPSVPEPTSILSLFSATVTMWTAHNRKRARRYTSKPLFELG
ncbi:hypothetical protein [Lacipirellula sp.]|uniref:hypothetical protein n=1 Tax=Lacipirellula sp. TaxID=2691419 RepID=UPI003D148A17